MDDFEDELARMMRDSRQPAPFRAEQRERLYAGIRARRRSRTLWRAGGSALAVAGLSVVLALLPGADSRSAPADRGPLPATDPTPPPVPPSPTSAPSTSEPPAGPTSTTSAPGTPRPPDPTSAATTPAPPTQPAGGPSPSSTEEPARSD